MILQNMFNDSSWFSFVKNSIFNQLNFLLIPHLFTVLFNILQHFQRVFTLYFFHVNGFSNFQTLTCAPKTGQAPLECQTIENYFI